MYGVAKTLVLEKNLIIMAINGARAMIFTDKQIKEQKEASCNEAVVSSESLSTVYIKTKDCDGDDMYYGVAKKFYKENEAGYLNLFKRGSHKLSLKPDLSLFEIFDGKELTIEIGFSC